MFNWLRQLFRRRRSFFCSVHRDLAGADACPVCEGYTRGYAEGARIEKRLAESSMHRAPLHERIETQQRKTRTSERYDEIQRRKKRKRKGHAHA